MTLKELLDQKNKRLSSIPKGLQKVVEDQQAGVFEEITSLLNKLEIDGGDIKINAKNLKLIAQISDDLKGVVLTDDYINGVKEFAKEFNSQAAVNKKLFSAAGFSETIPELAALYVEQAKKNAISSLVGAPIDTEFIKPVQGLLETAVTTGASYKETIAQIRTFVEGSKETDSKLLKYVKQVTNDSFAIADRSFTNIVSEALGAEWYYYSGGEFDTTRCFCEERVGKYFHYKEIESWGDGDNLGDCNIGGGRWAGMIPGTNSSTIFSYAGGYNCQHSFMIVSEAIVPDSDIERAKNLGYIAA